jgi:segregation and condensation protein A
VSVLIGSERDARDATSDRPSPRFTVRLDNFSGPFDLLLQLISRHELDVTEVALHQVTDDFIEHTKALAASGEDADLNEITEFLVIAATLLDLKAARLLPGADVDDVEDLALLEARDLLFARLLQYRAYKQVAALFVELQASAMRRYPRSVALEDRYAALLPEVLLGMDAQRFAELAAAVFRPKPPPTVSLDHLHVRTVSVPEHMALLRERLAKLGRASFHDLTRDCGEPLLVVARFLAVLELHKEASVHLDQEESFGDLMVTWAGAGVSG